MVKPWSVAGDVFMYMKIVSGVITLKEVPDLHITDLSRPGWNPCGLSLYNLPGINIRFLYKTKIQLIAVRPPLNKFIARKKIRD